VFSFFNCLICLHALHYFICCVLIGLRYLNFKRWLRDAVLSFVFLLFNCLIRLHAFHDFIFFLICIRSLNLKRLKVRSLTFERLAVWMLNVCNFDRLNVWRSDSLQFERLSFERLDIWHLNVWRCGGWRLNALNFWTFKVWILETPKFDVRTFDRLKVDPLTFWTFEVFEVLCVWAFERLELWQFEVWTFECLNVWTFTVWSLNLCWLNLWSSSKFEATGTSRPMVRHVREPQQWRNNTR